MYMTVIYFRMADIRAILAQATGFEWDAGSSEADGSSADSSDTGVTRAECEQLFLNEPLVVADDATGSSVAKVATGSSQDIRGHALGETDEGHLLFAAFVVRDGLVRVTGARPMTRSERQVYTDVRDEEESS